MSHGSHSSHSNHGNHASHSNTANPNTHGSHNNHGNHSNHANTSPKPPAGNYDLEWDVPTVVDDDIPTYKETLKKVKSNIYLLRKNKGPWGTITDGVGTLENPVVGPSNDNLIGTNNIIKGESFSNMRSDLNSLVSWMKSTTEGANDGGNSSTPAITTGEVIKASKITTLKNEVQSLAATDLSSKHASHWNSTYGAGHSNHSNALAGHSNHTNSHVSHSSSTPPTHSSHSSTFGHGNHNNTEGSAGHSSHSSTAPGGFNPIP